MLLPELYQIVSKKLDSWSTTLGISNSSVIRSFKPGLWTLNYRKSIVYVERVYFSEVELSIQNVELHEWLYALWWMTDYVAKYKFFWRGYILVLGNQKKIYDTDITNEVMQIIIRMQYGKEYGDIMHLNIERWEREWSIKYKS